MKNFNAKDMLNNLEIWNKNKSIREQNQRENILRKRKKIK